MKHMVQNSWKTTSRNWMDYILVIFIFICYCSLMNCKAQVLSYQGNVTGGMEDIHTPRGLVRSSTDELYSLGTFSGTFILGGDTLQSAESNAVYLAKYDLDLSVLWMKRIAENRISVIIHPTWASIAIDSEDNLIVGMSYTGSLYYNDDTSGVPGAIGAVLMKLDSEGNFLWTTDTEGDELGYKGIDLDNDDNIIITGYLGNDIFISRYSPEGALIWHRTAGGPTLMDQGRAVAVDHENNVYVSGIVKPSNSVYFDSIHLTFPFSTFIASFIAKYNSEGVVQWVRYVYSTTSMKFTLISDIQCLADGSVVAVGGYADVILRFSNGLSSVGPHSQFYSAPFITSFDPDGNRQWVRVSPSDNGSSGSAVVTRKDSTLHVITGIDGTIINQLDTVSVYGDQDLIVERYDLSGNMLSYTHIGGSGLEIGNDLLVANNSIYMIGGTQSQTVNVGAESFTSDYASSMYIIKLAQGPIGIPQLEQEQQAVLYPNPNNGSFTLKAQGLHGTVSVTDVTGKVVFTGIANAFGLAAVALTDPTNGVYFVHFLMNGIPNIQKVMVGLLEQP